MTQHLSPDNYEIEIDVDTAFRAEVDEMLLRTAAVATLQHEGIDAAALTILVTGDETMRDYNRQYRNIDAPTDVLSFAAQEGEDPVQDLPPELAAEMAAYLGDLVVAFPYTAEQAKRYGNTLEAELRLLVVHGTLHLLGYDHDTAERQASMWHTQGQILQSLGDSSTNWEREL